jgi:glyoxylase-like metal-dependent hydrolase (beta-lactamase superfamily II)
MDKAMTGVVPAAQVEGVYHRKLGDAVVTSLNDGHIQGALQIVEGLSEEAGHAALAAEFRADPPLLQINAFVVRSRGRVALIDAGGGDIAPTCGRMAAALVQAGIDPLSVDTVLLTHLHRDHVRGLVDDVGAMRFPNATLHAHQDDIDLWLNPERGVGLKPVLAAQFVVVPPSLTPYGDRLQAFRGEKELFPGVFSVELPGHSPGHCGFRIGAGAEALLIWGDVMHIPEIQARHPEATLVFDWEPEVGVASRKRMLDMAANEKLLVAGMHMQFPGYAHIARAEGAYRVVPDVWTTRF